MFHIVCLDLWNTLIHASSGSATGYMEYMEPLRRRGIKENAIHRIVRDTIMTRDLSYAEMVRALTRHFQVDLSPKEEDEMVRRWQDDNDSAQWSEGAEELLRTLRRSRYELILITNLTAPAWETVDQKFRLAARFDRLVLSFKQGRAKPDPLVWENVQREAQPKYRVVGMPFTGGFNLSTRFWMVGDNEADDLTIPRRMGWNTIRVGAGQTPLVDIPNIIKRS